MSALLAARREYLSAAISDAEGTIRATDTKASIALVLHGLLFSGLLAALGHVGDAYRCASDSIQFAIAGALCAASGTFIISVGQLLRCIRPAPASAIPILPPGKVAGTFFLKGKTRSMRGRWELDRSTAALVNELTTLTEPAMIQELAAELIILSGIRGRKTALITSGIRWLACTFAAVVTFLLLVGSQVV